MVLSGQSIRPHPDPMAVCQRPWQAAVRMVTVHHRPAPAHEAFTSFLAREDGLTARPRTFATDVYTACAGRLG